MTTTKKAVAYVSDIVLGTTGEVIGREVQKETVRRHAEENGYQLVAIFEDDAYADDVISRPGIQRLLACDEPYDCVLVERVWALSRQWNELAPMLKEMQRRGRRIESALCLWDCVSQRARHYFRESSKAFAGASAAPVLCTQAVHTRVNEPSRLNFANLRRRPVHA